MSFQCAPLFLALCCKIVSCDQSCLKSVPTITERQCRCERHITIVSDKTHFVFPCCTHKRRKCQKVENVEMSQLSKRHNRQNIAIIKNVASQGFYKRHKSSNLLALQISQINWMPNIHNCRLCLEMSIRDKRCSFLVNYFFINILGIIFLFQTISNMRIHFLYYLWIATKNNQLDIRKFPQTHKFQWAIPVWKKSNSWLW